MSIGNWLLWIGGGAVSAAGMALLVWAIVGDRLRGRHKLRRCPRCWYDMAGVPGLTCPECGREAVEERRLHRTRRRWKWAAVAVVVVLIGAAGVATPAMRARGVSALVPTTAVILMYTSPTTEQRPVWYNNLLYERIGRKTIPRWQRRLLFWRCDGILRSEATYENKLWALRMIESVAYRARGGSHTGEATDAAPVLVRALSDADPRVRGFAAALLPTVGGEPGELVPALAAAAGSDPDGDVRRSAVGALFRLAEHAAPAADSVIAASRFEGTPYLQRDALMLLGRLDPSTASVTLPVLDAALEAPTAELRHAALDALRALGAAAAPAVPGVMGRLHDPEPYIRRDAARTLAATGVADPTVVEALFASLTDGDRHVRTASLLAIEVLARRREGMMRRIEEWLRSIESEEAAHAVVALGDAGADIRPFADLIVPRLSVPGRGEWETRWTTAKLLCLCGYADQAARQAAEALRGDEIRRVRVWGELLVAQLDGDRTLAVPALILLAGSDGPGGSNTRGDAAEALALIGPGAEAALPCLEAMLKEEAWAPREYAKRAIHAITGEPLEGRLAPASGPQR